MKLRTLNIYQIVSIILLVVGLFFSYMIADMDDAPGVVILGSAITAGCTLFLYGLGEIIVQLKKKNRILSDIHKELKSKKK